MKSYPGSFDLLLQFLSIGHSNATDYNGWYIQPISGGANNRLYRVTGDQGDYAVKFTLRDSRDRAGREYHSLQSLELSGLEIAPQAILLERDRYPLPVVVMTWLDGEPLDLLENTDQTWQHMVDYLSTLHQLTAVEPLTLPPPVLSALNEAQCDQIIREKSEGIPHEHQSPRLRALINRYLGRHHVEWKPPRLSLIRGDPNPRNFLFKLKTGRVQSVDWEYSGVADPAFEIADLCAHAAYLTLPESRWQSVIDQYVGLSDDHEMRQRIEAYRRMMLVWWCLRFVQYLYEIPRGLDPRLVERNADWEADSRAKLECYLDRAEAQLENTL